jgi:hypothetical protein
MSRILFDDPIDAMEELEFLVKSSQVTHRMFRDNKGKYFIQNLTYFPSKRRTTLVVELNYRTKKYPIP